MSKYKKALDDIGNIAGFVAENCGNADTAKYMNDIISIVQAALAEPVRNCDVGTPTEQKARYESFCKECQRITRDLPCNFDTECVFKWEQMPYKEESK